MKNDFLDKAMIDMSRGNLSSAFMIFTLLDSYLSGAVTEKEFLNDLRVICGTEI